MGLVHAVRDMRTIKQLLTEAEAEARRGGEERHGPEHLLIAAATLPDGTAARALARVGVHPDQLRTAVQSVHTAALDGVGIEPTGTSTALRAPATGALHATPQAQQVFQRAVAMAKSRKPSLLSGAHVVAAVCDLERGTLVRALAALGVDLAELRTAARTELGMGA